MEEHGEIDDEDDAEAEGKGITLEAAGLDPAQQVAGTGRSAAQPADQQAVDEELVEEVDDGGEGVLEVTDEEVVVEAVEVETIAQQRDETGSWSLPA